MDAPDDAGARIIRRIEELLYTSTLPPEQVLNILRRADAKTGTDALTVIERLEREQRSKE